MSLRPLAAFLAALLAVGCAAVERPAPPKPSFAPASGWTMEGGDAARLSVAPAAPKVSFADGNRYVEYARPAVESRSGETVAPLVIGDAVFFGTAKKVFSAAEWKSGNPVWIHETRGNPQGSPVWSSDLVIFGDDAGWVEALTPEGKKAWEFKATNAVAAPLVAANGRVFVSSLDQNHWCLDAATGKPLWQYEEEVKREGAIWRASSPAVADGMVFFGLSEGEVVALDEVYGRTLWKMTLPQKTPVPDISAGPSVEGGVVYVGAFDGPVAALSAQTGEILWQKPHQAHSPLAVGPDALYFGTRGGEVMAVGKKGGEKLWSVPLERGAANAPVLAGGSLYVGTSLGYFFELDAKTGATLQSFGPGSGVQARAWVGEAGVAFLSNAGVLHLIDRRR